jgi:putative RecB family exonuclease
MTTQIIPTNGNGKGNGAGRLPSFQEMREGLHVSYSQITQYMICPLKFQFQYVQGVSPEFIGAALPFGSAIHHTIALLYKQLQATDKAPSKSEVQEVFADRWEWQQKNEQIEVKFKAGKESWDSLKDMGAKMLAAYYDYADSMSMLVGENVVCVEQGLRGDLVKNTDSMSFVGVIDLILRDPSNPNLFHIIDHKTAARRYDENKVAKDMQLTAYKWLVEKSGYLGDDSDEYELSLRWDVILKLKKEPVVERYTTTRGETDVRRFLRTTRVILRAIENAVFFPQPSWACADCGFKFLCNAWS